MLRISGICIQARKIKTLLAITFQLENRLSHILYEPCWLYILSGIAFGYVHFKLWFKASQALKADDLKRQEVHQLRVCTKAC